MSDKKCYLLSLDFITFFVSSIKVDICKYIYTCFSFLWNLQSIPQGHDKLMWNKREIINKVY